MPAEARERIFEPFYTRRPQGIALGLALAAEIVAQHGGQISVGCAPLGGARFAVRLPLAK